MKVFEKGGFSLFFYGIHTNYLGNYQKEITKFAPHLKTMEHHGSDRLRNPADFKAAYLEHNVVIASFTLAGKDAKNQI
ncbi:hypothetical protein BV378_08670 [Nostoc sp. RF31YmG]|jgi:SNF2 family DNA or RNA helicase|nr:hypothetical protein BV378_08670 [Nostoc sp. RF31YmG]